MLDVLTHKDPIHVHAKQGILEMVKTVWTSMNVRRNQVHVPNIPNAEILLVHIHAPVMQDGMVMAEHARTSMNATAIHMIVVGMRIALTMKDHIHASASQDIMATVNSA